MVCCVFFCYIVILLVVVDVSVSVSVSELLCHGFVQWLKLTIQTKRIRSSHWVLTLLSNLLYDTPQMMICLQEFRLTQNEICVMRHHVSITTA